MSDIWVRLGLHKWINQQLLKMNIKKPTQVQEQCIPAILSGRDCIGCAETGSGKTAAFALPILQKLSEDPYGVCALVLTPTRELASQISDQFVAFGESIRVKVSLVVGGESLTFQSINLSKKPHVVVATPGRLASLLRENSQYFHFKRLKFLVLDEVDALLVPGDLERDIETILDLIPPASSRQTLAFSATSNDVIEVLKNSSKNSVFTFISRNEIATVPELSEYYLLAPIIAKDAFLVYLLQTKLGVSIEKNDNGQFTVKNDPSEKDRVRQAIVFTATCWQCHVTTRLLLKLGFKCAVLHSALSQKLRNKALSQFRSHHVRILVATALAGRGLDIPSVDLVINFSLPYTHDEYIHHVGRTARAGHIGTSISFVAPFELERLLAIEDRIGKKLQEYKFDNEKEAEKLIKPCALIKTEITNELYHNTDTKLNRKIERNKRLRKTNKRKLPPVVDNL